jgi:hypothetical protein
LVLCTAPLGILIVYQLLKPALRWNFDTELGAPIRLSWMAVLLVVILLLFLSRGLMRMKGPFQLESLTTGLFLLILGWSTVVVQKVGDGDLTSVFGLGWFEAGQYAADVGIRNAISDWNSSANPDGDFLFEEIPALWLRSAEMIGLGSAFDKTWGRTDRRFNHRMNLHPPVYALTLSLWLRFFGQSRQAAIVYELVIKCLLVMLVVAWTKELLPVDQQNKLGVAVVAFFASLPPLFLQIEPQNHELAILFTSVGVWRGMRANQSESQSAWNGMLIGALFGLSSFTSFFQLLVFPALLLSVLAFGRRRDRIQTVWITIGYVAVATIFVGLGYFPWLTIYSSIQRVELYRSLHPVDLATALVEHAYLGIPAWLLLATGLRFSLFKDPKFRVWMVPQAVALFASLYFSYGTITGQRYSSVFLFAMVPLFAEALRLLKLNRLQMLTIPTSNVLFTMVTVFL